MAGASSKAALNEWGKWLSIASALIAAGVLPRTWQKGVAVASAVVFAARVVQQ